jgi:U3 small nucleolar RNA-associated protein 19
MPAPIRSLPPPSKKRKRNPGPPFPVALRIEPLESTLIDAVQSSASLNPLADLLDLAQTAADARDVSRTIYALYRSFVVLLGTGRMIAGVEGQNAGGEEGKIVRAWLWERLGLYGDLLVGLMKDEDSGLRVCAFSLCLFSLVLTSYP